MPRYLSHPSCVRSPLHGQRGLTLIELMVSITIGMVLVAGLATLFASQSSTRAEIDRSGRLIENGRYAMQTLVEDLELAGYWGELTSLPAVPGALPNPCTTTSTDIDAAIPIHVQGYNAPVVSPLTLPSCLSNYKAGTDVLVVRRADTTPLTVASATTPPVAGQTYLQTGLTTSGISFTRVLGTNNFTLYKKDRTTLADVRNVLVHIYYISECSVPIGTSCTGADGGVPIPTLKRVELTVASNAPALTTTSIAEGIENLQLDYGVDADGNDGAPDGTDGNGAAFAAADWAQVVNVKAYLLARSVDKSAGFSDNKTYTLGTAGSFGPYSDSYPRHVFSQSVRLINPSSRGH